MPVNVPRKAVENDPGLGPCSHAKYTDGYCWTLALDWPNSRYFGHFCSEPVDELISLSFFCLPPTSVTLPFKQTNNFEK